MKAAILFMIVWWLDLQLPVQLMPITIKVVVSNPVHDEVYSIQHYVINFVSDLRKVSGFLRVLQFPPPIKVTTTIKWNTFESGIKHHNPNLNQTYWFCFSFKYIEHMILYFVSGYLYSRWRHWWYISEYWDS